MRIFLCGNTGSVNHGCEAIVRSTIKVLGVPRGEIYLCSYAPDQDFVVTKNVGINMISYRRYPTSIQRYFIGAIKKFFGSITVGERYTQKPLIDKIEKDDICLIIGGDTYCYGMPTSNMAINMFAKKKGAKTILWCHSIEKSIINNSKIKRDLLRYDKILVRDVLTYNFLIEGGIPKKNVIKVCDPAFFLDVKKTELPERFLEGNTVGINISSGVIKDKYPLSYANILNTARYILDKTDMNICLIPHVYSIKNNIGDHIVLQRLKKDLGNERVSIIDRDCTCEELKYIISKCRFMIAARTHASIAAYSSGIPTLVIGYSIKSKGIATDLFGRYKDFVFPYTELKNDNEILNSFRKLIDNEKEIKERLISYIPEYQSLLENAIKEIFPLKNKKVKTCPRDICSGCGACATICPIDCITMTEDMEGFQYPIVDINRCINCGKCGNVCPVLNKPIDDGIKPDVYGCKVKDGAVRNVSSSGGMFTALAEHIIDEGGSVFGCILDNELQAIHTVCSDKSGLAAMRGSKYIQSKIGYSYAKARIMLEEGRKVLFTGTACQIGGLYSYLGKDYDNLITVDLICHGVPSPKLWRKYIEYREKQSGEKVIAASFRNKANGWKTYSMRLLFENGTEYLKRNIDDPWIGFLVSDLANRSSCAMCSFKQMHRQADITLADMWAVRYYIPEWNDDKGVSLVLIHSQKGKEMLSEIKSMIACKTVDVDYLKKYANSYFYSHPSNPMRSEFFTDMLTKDIHDLERKYTGNNIYAKIRRKIAMYFK